MCINVTQIYMLYIYYRAADDIKQYQNECVPVTHDTVEGAVKWLWELDRLAGVSSTSCVEAVLRAVEDKHVRVMGELPGYIHVLYCTRGNSFKFVILS